MREDVEMSFGDHLDELRRRVLWALAGLILAAVFCGINYEFLLSALIRPYKHAYDKMIARKLGTEEKQEQPDQQPDRAEQGEALDVPEDSPLAPVLKAIEKRLLDLERRLGAIAPEKEAGPEAAKEDVAYAKRFPSPRIIQPSPLTGYVTIILLCVICGIILGSPWILYQIWAFVGVGLYPHERRFVYIYGPFSFFLFIGGAATFYFFLLPVGLQALMGPTAGILVDNIPMVEPSFLLNEYFKFVALLTLVFGIVFQTPLVVMFIAWTEIVPLGTLFKQQRVILLILCVLAAMFTPPDPVTMGLMAVPMVLLYWLGLLLAWITLRKKRKRHAEGEDEDWWGGDEETSTPTAPTTGPGAGGGAALPPHEQGGAEHTEQPPADTHDEGGPETDRPYDPYDEHAYDYEREIGAYGDEDDSGAGEYDSEDEASGYDDGYPPGEYPYEEDDDRPIEEYEDQRRAAEEETRPADQPEPPSPRAGETTPEPPTDESPAEDQGPSGPPPEEPPVDETPAGDETAPEEPPRDEDPETDLPPEDRMK